MTLSYLHHASSTFRALNALFYLTSRRQKISNSTLSQGKLDFYVTNSQSEELERRTMMTSTLLKPRMNLMDFRSTTNYDRIHDIQNILNSLERTIK